MLPGQLLGSQDFSKQQVHSVYMASVSLSLTAAHIHSPKSIQFQQFTSKFGPMSKIIT